MLFSLTYLWLLDSQMWKCFISPSRINLLWMESIQWLSFIIIHKQNRKLIMWWEKWTNHSLDQEHNQFRHLAFGGDGERSSLVSSVVITCSSGCAFIMSLLWTRGTAPSWERTQLFTAWKLKWGLLDFLLQGWKLVETPRTSWIQFWVWRREIG